MKNIKNFKKATILNAQAKKNIKGGKRVAKFKPGKSLSD